jgi:hypothetical protein
MITLRDPIETLDASAVPYTAACQASADACTLPQLAHGARLRGAGCPPSEETLQYRLALDEVHDDEDTLVWPPMFFGEPVRQPPHSAELPLPDRRVASALEPTERQTPLRGSR